MKLVKGSDRPSIKGYRCGCVQAELAVVKMTVNVSIQSGNDLNSQEIFAASTILLNIVCIGVISRMVTVFRPDVQGSGLRCLNNSTSPLGLSKK
jgi:hypothetical protein